MALRSADTRRNRLNAGSVPAPGSPASCPPTASAAEVAKYSLEYGAQTPRLIHSRCNYAGERAPIADDRAGQQEARRPCDGVPVRQLGGESPGLIFSGTPVGLMYRERNSAGQTPSISTIPTLRALPAVTILQQRLVKGGSSRAMNAEPFRLFLDRSAYGRSSLDMPTKPRTRKKKPLVAKAKVRAKPRETSEQTKNATRLWS